jgi:hypothetical protein
VEFALISIILFSLILGIIEMGRFMFIFTQITAAAEEGARFGSENPIQVIQAIDDSSGVYGVGHANNDCNIVTKAWERLVLVPKGGHWATPPLSGVNVEVAYDGGTSTTPCNDQCDLNAPGVSFSAGRDRVRVTAWYQFHFLTGILDRFVPASGLRIEMTSARTILRNQRTQPTAPTCETPPPP